MGLTATLIFLAAFQSNFYEQGMKALEAKRYQEAVDNLNNAIAAEPKDYALHFNLALAYSLLGKDAEGITEYKKTLEIKPDVYQAELNLAILLIRDNRQAEAIPYLTAAVAQKPKEFRPNYYLAEALLETAQFEKAEQAYKSALGIDPKSAAAESGLGRALAKQNHLPEAASHFRKAAEMDPAYRDSLLELAALYEDAKQPDDAIAIYQQFPENAAAQERVGALLLQTGKGAEAVAHLEDAVSKSPTAANRAALATAYLKNKQQDRAFPLITQLLQAQPNDYELRMVYGRMLRDDRKLKEAAQEFYRAAQIKPDSAEAWSEMAGVLVVAEDYPGAIAALDKLAALHAEKPGHVFLRAIVMDKLKQLKPALESYQRFLEMSQGQSPNEEFKARQRARIIQRELSKR
ncbi:MAG: tetratricopeptide repeat protein [Bryobacteraceae bacterium]